MVGWLSWLKAPVSKTGRCESVSRVQIPPPPPMTINEFSDGGGLGLIHDEFFVSKWI